jgi:phosphomethylpyrimidine synthase
LAAAAGADFLCYVTASEHLALPTVEDVHEGVIACRIAAHAGDIVKGVPGALEKDIAMAKCRKELDWEGQFAIAMDPEKARRIRAESGVDEEHGACTMCGEFCAYKVMNERKGGVGSE